MQTRLRQYIIVNFHLNLFSSLWAKVEQTTILTNLHVYNSSSISENDGIYITYFN